MVLVLFFRVKSCLCVDIQLHRLPSVREICCGCLLWGGYCKNREILSDILSAAYTRRHKIVHLCTAELKAFHLTPSQHLLFFLSSEGPHLQTKTRTDIWGKWYLLKQFLHGLIACEVHISPRYFNLSNLWKCDLSNLYMLLRGPSKHTRTYENN